MTRVIVAETKHNCEHLMCMFLDESHYDILVEEDTDCFLPLAYGEDKTEQKVAFKFRKNFFTKEEQDAAYHGLREAAQRTENRGLASGIKAGTQVNGEGREWVTNYQEEMIQALRDGRKAALFAGDPIDIVRAKYPTPESRLKALGSGKNNVWVISRFRGKFNFDEWVDSIKSMTPEERASSCEETMKMISETSYGNPVDSGIAGWFDRYPRIPYGRATTYTRDNFDKFKMSFPFLQHLAKGFKELMPWRYGNQMEAAKKIDSRYLIPETPFTTVTVNKTFRTAAHRDAGDLDTGLSNLLVLSNDGRFSGGYLIFPEIRVAVNVRPGDLLLVNNHEIIHGNTPIVCEEGSERVSLVVYFREKMLELGSKEYEDLRFEYVESRRTNTERPEKIKNKLWNGVSPGMWEEEEWYDFLREKGGEHMLHTYHPKASAGSLADFLG